MSIKPIKVMLEFDKDGGIKSVSDENGKRLEPVKPSKKSNWIGPTIHVDTYVQGGDDECSTLPPKCPVGKSPVCIGNTWYCR